MKYLLDTNVVSELRKASTAHEAVVAWAASVRAQDMGVSVVTLLEIEKGVLRAKRRDTQQALVLSRWLNEVLRPQFEDRIIDIDVEIALCCAALHVPDPKPELDALITATALTRELTLVTRNTRDFDGTGVKLFNPWEAT